MREFWELCHSGAHWAFELMLMLLFDGFIGALAWPWIRRRMQHHVEDDLTLEALEQRLWELEAKVRAELKRRQKKGAEPVRAAVPPPQATARVQAEPMHAEHQAPERARNHHEDE